MKGLRYMKNEFAIKLLKCVLLMLLTSLEEGRNETVVLLSERKVLFPRFHKHCSKTALAVGIYCLLFVYYSERMIVICAPCYRVVHIIP